MREVRILSPHRDDAVFSLFFSLRRWSKLPVRLHLVNFFTVSGYAPRTATGNSAFVSAIRKREDRHALRQIGGHIQVTDASLLDAPLRLSIDASTVCEPGRRYALEPQEQRVVAARLRIAGNSVALAPLALGDHVDHWAIHDAAVKSIPAAQLAFYEDLPYASWTPEAAILERIAATGQATGIPLWPVVIRARGSMGWKERTSARYGSQIGRDMAMTIARFGARYGCGERLWIPRSPRRRWRELLA